MTEVLGILLQIVAEGTALVPVEVIKMTIDECLLRAVEINALPMKETPFVLMCSPIIEAGLGV